MEKNWIVISGRLLDTTAGGGGFECFGPYTKTDARLVREHVGNCNGGDDLICVAVELLSPNLPERIRIAVELERTRSRQNLAQGAQ